jgi:hypothetical protein
VKKLPSYKVNEDYFDEINSPDKAYWLGFIWCDGYVARRERKGLESFEIKVSLSSIDKSHIEKLAICLETNIPIREYAIYGVYEGNREARLLIAKSSFGRKLYYNYGIVPYRDNMEKLLEMLPHEYYRDFLRGMVDADGSIISRDIVHKSSNRKEFSIGLTTNKTLVEFFNHVLIEEGLTQTRYKLSTKNDGDPYVVYRNLRITGNNIVEKILDWLYENSEMHLDRKRNKYMEIKKYMDGYRREKCKV